MDIINKSESLHKSRIFIRKQNMNKMKHNSNESYLQSLTEEERTRQMREWSPAEWQQYYCPKGTMTLEEFKSKGYQIIKEEYKRLGWM